MSLPTLPVKVDKGSGTPLVLLHGLGNNSSSWQYVLEYLDATKWHIIALDLLGFGDAPKPRVNYTPTDHADAVIASLDALGLKKVVLAGHSMGSLVAVDVASRFPERVSQLILVGAPLYKEKPRSSKWRRFTRSEGMYFRIFEAMKNSPEVIQTGDDIMSGVLVKGMEVTKETWPAFKKSMEHTIMQFESYKQATQLAIPTIFIWGRFDYFVISRNIRTIKRLNKQHIYTKRTFSSHGLSKRHGKVIAKIINRLPISGYMLLS